MLKRYAIWDKESPVIVPTGKVFTAAQWKEKYPVAALESVTVVCAAGEVNGGSGTQTLSRQDLPVEGHRCPIVHIVCQAVIACRQRFIRAHKVHLTENIPTRLGSGCRKTLTA